MGNREIEIAIHGTNGGYRTITRDPVAGLFDARRDYSKVASMGSEAYSIHFREGCVIFSKYKIVRDVLGDSRTGNIAFSVIVPIDKKFEIADVKSLLDRVDTEFSNKEFSEGKTYIKNNNLGAVRNDWAFLDKIKEDYEPKFRN
ncbi:MAG: hypothetical protein LBB74_03975, partial [Chitinispirillales bacterium]|nr:hypothetical protein [Chitinispirillales bacterium]